MKIKNKKTEISIGNKSFTFTNMILDSYLDLFADSFIKFEDKQLTYCLVSFTDSNEGINEASTTMNYDIVLEAVLLNQTEDVGEKKLTYKYWYYDSLDEVKNYIGSTIKSLGFAKEYVTDNGFEGYKLYAFLDVSMHNLLVNESQPFIVHRVDEIETELEFYSNFPILKGPLHLSKLGLVNYLGMEYTQTYPFLDSIGFGVLPYTLDKEYLAEDLNIERTDTGTIEINDQLELDMKYTLYFDSSFEFDGSKNFSSATYPYLIFKYEMYDEYFEDPDEGIITYVDTGKWYTQYIKINKQGKLDLKIKYERG